MLATADTFLTIAEARQFLGGISKAKMADLIKTGVIPTHPNALDGRSRLIKEADLRAFLAKGARARKKKEQSTHD